MHGHLLQDIGLCIVAATALVYVARLVHQPLLLAYIGAGVAIGPVGLGLITDQKSIETLAELGLAFLLFIVGLEIDVKKLVASGRAAAIVTVVQVGGSAALGWAAALALGYGGLPAVYVDVAVAFSSTMIVIKLLSDRAELDTLPGQMTLAILLVQDVLAVVVLAIQPQLGSGAAGGSALASIGVSIVKGLGLGAASLALSRHVLPRLFRFAAESPEILLLSAISWCFLVSFAAMKAGFSVAMGALIAGVGMAELPYSLEVVAKIRSLRDFFVTLFFVSLGMLITVPTRALLIGTAALSALVVATRFATILPALRALGYDNRIGILSSLHLSQISEFALVIVLIGVSDANRHIGPEIVSLVVMTLVVTSTASTYLVRFSHRIAAALVRALEGTRLEDQQSREMPAAKRHGAPVILVGCFRVASSLIHDLRQAGKEFAVIDYNPKVHAELRKLGIECTFGDIGHLDTLEHAGVHGAQILVSSISDDFLRGTDNRKVLAALRKINPTAKIFVTADSIARALELYRSGADYVIVPRVLAADRILEMIERAEAGELERLRAQEIEQLEARLEVVP